MKSLFAVLLAVAFGAPGFGQEVVLLRTGVAGGAAETIEERGKNGVHDRAVMNVTAPSLTVYLPPKEKATGMAIVICPGGGYHHLAIDKEGHDIARWMNTIGVAAMVLKYRLPGTDNMRLALGDVVQAAKAARVAIEDGEEAMRVVRVSAGKWNARADAVGMMGFSAGGHLAAMVGMLAEADARPNFLVLGYPAIPKDLEVPATTPRTFLVHADDDRLAAGDNSVRFYLALKKAKVPAEMHVYASGGHGFGMLKTDKTSAAWPEVLAAWLKTVR